MTDLQALLDSHLSTRLLRVSFPRDDGPQAKLMVNRFEGTEYLPHIGADIAPTPFNPSVG
ncbi:hypothetical protein [Pseudoduganella buxea]|uniref:Uncharacterized protein n=1 Tax=Pseudoduganella buxea TaxID=1949069 RepID=A0A6I3T2U3_9BURK|nr:hypothetical protein [Pseudoduganella buxea]MTV55940.1 hypothetical protein [Pseudoduganella buxea]GGC21669.1 hypothetical protein GCM10011572_48900 [Pseudoduganella buxea]